MSNLYGWTGKILRVDLTDGQITMANTGDYVPDYVGGLGIAAKIAWDELAPGTEALSPENLLFLMVGPLTGSLASGSSRVVVAGIAPQQRPSVFSRSGMGGHWGAELKYAGFDGIVIKGRSEKPVYLWINDGQVEIRDASELWGKGTYATTSILRAQHDQRARIVSIGPAGENLCRIACLQTETGNAAGQGGFGAVMGSKNLKAIAVRGTQSVRVADPQGLLNLSLTASREGQSPLKPGIAVREINNTTARRLKKCGFCYTPCANVLVMGMPGEHAKGTHTAAWHCWGFTATSSEAHTEAREVVADMSLNGWEVTYGIIPWLQMCKQKGLIDAIDGLEIPVPDHPVRYNNDKAPVSGEFLQMLLRKIAFREGELGDALADGACYAAEKLFDGRGKPLLDWIYPRHAGQTSHWNGHWGTGGNIYFPFWLVPILQWCVDTRDPASDSTHSYTEHFLPHLPEHGPQRGPLTLEEVRAVCAQVYGHPGVGDPQYAYDEPETKTLPAIWHHNRGILVESLVLCDREHARVFSLEAPDRKADTTLMSKFFSVCTGFETSEAELDLAADRVFNLLRAIDIRNHGRSRATDEDAARSLTHPAFTDGICLDLDQFWPMLDNYYDLRGWDRATGYPTRAKLESLGLGEVADALEALGVLVGQIE